MTLNVCHIKFNSAYHRVEIYHSHTPSSPAFDMPTVTLYVFFSLHFDVTRKNSNNETGHLHIVISFIPPISNSNYLVHYQNFNELVIIFWWSSGNLTMFSIQLEMTTASAHTHTHTEGIKKISFRDLHIHKYRPMVSINFAQVSSYYGHCNGPLKKKRI